MKSKNVIELNGHLYDAITGKMLGSSQSPRTSTGGGGNIDGFFRSRTAPSQVPAASRISVLTTGKAAPKTEHKAPRTSANHANAHKPQVSHRVRSDVTAPATTPLAEASAKGPRVHHIPINHAKAHKQQPSVTLMRKAVKRPQPSLKQQTNVQGALTHAVPGLIEVKRSAASVNPDRLVRASSVETSPMVAHHGKQVSQVSANVAPLAVQPAPTATKKPVATPPVMPAPQPGNNPTPSNPGDIFNHALANAANFIDVKEHRAHFRKQTRKHVASMAAGTLALLLIAMFAFYQNSPGLQLKMAGIHAGVATTMPNFQAAGFAYNGVKASSGKLTLGFSNKQGSYQLTQRNTSWSGSDMIQEVSSVDASGHPNYVTVHAGDTTVYRFDNTNATWVSGGKWYTVTGTGALSNDQVKSIVQNV